MAPIRHYGWEDVFELALQQHAGELTVAKEGPAHYKTAI